jgi:hypothetical protein
MKLHIVGLFRAKDELVVADILDYISTHTTTRYKCQLLVQAIQTLCKCDYRLQNVHTSVVNKVCTNQD